MPTPSSDTSNDPMDVQNPKFDKSGKNTRRAIGDGNQALQIARRLERDDDRRDYDRARVLAAFNGACPYDESELLALGQSYRFNVSFGFMEGVIGRSTVPYLELVNDSQYIANIDADLPEDKLNIIRDEFTELVKRWGKWPKMTSRLIQDLVLNGYNFVAFPSDFDPWPVFIEQKDGFVHELTPNDIGGLELFSWKRAYMIHELYAYIEDAEAAERAGWNVEVTRKSIENATQADVFQRHRGGGWTAVESAIRGGTLFSSIVGGKQINTYHVFASELNGRVTHYIVWNGNSGSSDEKSEDVTLFKRVERWEDMESVLVYFDLEAGDGKWHGSRGLGRRSFNTHRAIDKLRCGLLDQAFTSGLTILQPDNQESQESFNLAVVGPFAVIPAGLNVSENTVPSISATTFQVDALLSTTIEQRIGDVVPSVSTPTRRGTRTATEVGIADARSNMISKGNLTRFLDPMSKTMSIIVRRLLIPNSPDPYAEAFQAVLKAKGFKEEELRRIRGAKSTGRIESVLGNDRQNYTELLAAYRGDPDVDQKDLKRRHMASVIGLKEVGGLLIEGVDQTKQIESAREQMEEIAANLAGIPVPASPRDAHEIHLAVLLKWLVQQIQAYAQGQSQTPVQALDMAGQHAGQHVQYLKADKTKKQIAAQFEAQLKAVAGQLDQLQQSAKKALENQLTAGGTGGTVSPTGLTPSMVGGGPVTT